MESKSNKNISICCAMLKNKDIRCKYNVSKGSEFCGVHLNSKNIVRYNDHSHSKLPITISKLVKSPCMISVYNCSRLRYNTVTIKDLKFTLKYYKLSQIGTKRILFDMLIELFYSLLPFLQNLDYIIKLQKWYKKRIQMKICQLKNQFLYKGECVNTSDVLTMELLSDINNEYLIYYRDEKGFIYGFDIRSLDKLLKNGNVNPYTSKEIEKETVIKIKQLIKYLSLSGLYIVDNPTDELSNIPEFNTKRKIIKIFQDMDNLDQYTNPCWFLDLNTTNLIKFYKELEDIWNYRLNLDKETKKRICPPNGHVFIVEPKNVLKEHNNKDKLQNLCLTVIDRLINSATDRSDRVNGCIYVLLSFVIVNNSAAEALPSYYAMVTGNINNVNYQDIPI